MEKWSQKYRKDMNQSFPCPEECRDYLVVGYFVYILFTYFCFHLIGILVWIFSRKDFELKIT